MMPGRWWLIVVGPVVAAAAAWCRLSQDGGGCTADAAPSVAEPAVAMAQPVVSEPAKRSRVVVDKPHFDFGTMNAGETRRHKFKIRNAGDADLTLVLGDTSCKCTLAEMNDGRLPPGASTEVELEWHSDEQKPHFRHGAILNTNDPQQPTVQLVVEGRVLVAMSVTPHLIYFPAIPRNSEQTLHVLLFSQLSADVRVRSIESDEKRATLTLSEIADANVRTLVADERWVRDLAITVRVGDESGAVGGKITVRYAVGDSEHEQMIEFTFAGEIVNDFSIVGSNVVGKVLMMGTVRQAAGDAKTFYLHYRGPAEKLPQIGVGRLKPSGLQVRIGEPQRLSEMMTRFPLTIEVPPGMPELNLCNAELGELELTTSAADYPTLHVPLSVVVVR